MPAKGSVDMPYQIFALGPVDIELTIGLTECGAAEPS
jgi:hypothetical protein